MRLPPEFEKSLNLPNEQLRSLLSSLGEAPPVSIRVNPFKAKVYGPEHTIPWCKNGFYLNERPNFTADPAFHAGAYYPQEASSMFLDHIIRSLGLNRSPISCLDLCAAPGGKSTLLRSVLHDASFLLANEISPKRAAVLAENLIKWGHERIAISNLSPLELGSNEGVFDLVSIDAPCSGEGLFRKSEMAVDQWNAKLVEDCYIRQRQILSEIWPAVKEDGYVIYSTCTYNRLENEENLIWLKNNKDVDFIRVPLPENTGIEEVDENEILGYRFWPNRVKGEGFFVSVFRKRSAQKSRRKKKSFRLTKGIPELVNHSHFENEGSIFILDDFGLEIISGLLSTRRVFNPGFPVGNMKRSGFVPNHGLFMWRKQPEIDMIDLAFEDAIKYLKGEDVLVTNKSEKKVFASFEGFPLGQGKINKNRLISGYPKSLRIRTKYLEGRIRIALPKE